MAVGITCKFGARRDNHLFRVSPRKDISEAERGIVIIRLEELNELLNFAIMNSAATCVPNDP